MLNIRHLGELHKKDAILHQASQITLFFDSLCSFTENICHLQVVMGVVFENRRNFFCKRWCRSEKEKNGRTTLIKKTYEKTNDFI